MSSLNPKKLPLGHGVRVLGEDPSGLLAFAKPAGLLSHPNSAKDAKRALLNAPYNLEDECYEISSSGEEPVKIWLLNRLDSATSGVLLCATDPVTAEVVRQQFAEDKVRKKYFALVFGTLTPKTQLWRDRLQVSRDGGRLRTMSGRGAEAETEARLEKLYPGRYPISLVELRPITGRTHQLRVQCAERDLPIVGDQTYGNFGWNREFVRATKQKRLFLHSAEIAVNCSVRGRPVKFLARAPLPKEFNP